MGTLLSLGDCNTLGFQQAYKNAYPEQLAKLLGLDVLNCGCTMSTTREGLRFFYDNFTSNITLITIQYGLVDSWKTFRNAPYVLYYPNTFLRKIGRKIVKKFKKIGRILQFKNDFQSVNFIPLDLSKSRYNLFILYKLYKILTKENFDLIHSHANKATSMIATLKLFLKTPTIASLHNYKKNLSSFEKMDFVITVSNSIGKKLKNLNKKTVYNGINPTIYANLAKNHTFNKTKDIFTVCTVGRLVEAKRMDVLIKAFVNVKVKLIITGDGPKREDLEKLAYNLNIQDKIVFTGALDRQRVSKVLSDSHLFAMTSRNEGFPYTFIEAMFHNLPFVSTPVSDIENFIGKKYIIAHNSPEELTKKIDFIQSNYNDVFHDFEPIFKKAQSNLLLEHMTDEIIKIYKK
jgi:glycosyltransferase involved in cell wall biosynthesis